MTRPITYNDLMNSGLGTECTAQAFQKATMEAAEQLKTHQSNQRPASLDGPGDGPGPQRPPVLGLFKMILERISQIEGLLGLPTSDFKKPEQATKTPRPFTISDQFDEGREVMEQSAIRLLFIAQELQRLHGTLGF